MPITRKNTFVFRDLTGLEVSEPTSLSSNAASSSDAPSSPSSSEVGAGTVSYLLDITCRDYDFLSYGVDVKSDGAVLVYRVSRGGVVVGEKVVVGEEPVEVRVLRGREFYEVRAGCMFFAFFFFLG